MSGLQLALPDAGATAALGAALAVQCRRHPGGVIALRGTLGAGKTTLARGFLRALGVTGAVRSPTYTLLEIYPTRPPVLHLDLYRLADPEEVHGLGLDEWPPESSWWLVEWPERGLAELLEADLELLLEDDGAGGRSVRLSAAGAIGRAVLARLEDSLKEGIASQSE